MSKKGLLYLHHTKQLDLLHQLGLVCCQVRLDKREKINQQLLHHSTSQIKNIAESSKIT